MAPLIIHHVPEDEEFIGPDGIRRPYAVYDHSEANSTGARTRRVVPETGSFGKSRQRSRSRTGTPAAKREDPTFAVAETIFSQFLADRSTENSGENQRKPSLSSSLSQSSQAAAPLAQIDGNAGTTPRFLKQVHKEPTEIILRGFRPSQQYAAIREYERIAGRICENYDRESPPEQRRYRTDVRDATVLQQKPLTAEEKLKANRFAGGNHWIKVTFESAEAAEIAIESSPQMILGHMIYAEMYRGVPPTSDEEVLVSGETRPLRSGTTQSLGVSSGTNLRSRKASSTLPRSFGTPAHQLSDRPGSSLSPPESNTSSNTIDTATVASTSSSATITDPLSNNQTPQDNMFCTRIPTAKRIKLIDASQALLPQPSLTSRVLKRIPIIGWFTADPIGTELPMNEQGEFDFGKASMYWKVMYLIEYYTGLPVCVGKFKEE